MYAIYVYLLLYTSVRTVHGYCSGLGANPGFTGPPKVEQVNLTTVLVSWKNLVTRVDCADQFLVKTGLLAAPNDFIMTDKLETSTFQTIITNRVPEMEYFYLVIAREQKGWLGVDYNRSPETYFATSRRKTNLSQEKIREAQQEQATTSASSPSPQNTKKPNESLDDTPNKKPGSDDTLSTPSAPLVDSVKAEDEGNTWVQSYLVWIIVGSIGGAIIIVGVLYNLRKKMKPEGSVQLDIEFNPELDDSFEEDGGDSFDDSDDVNDDSEEAKEFERMKISSASPPNLTSSNGRGERTKTAAKSSTNTQQRGAAKSADAGSEEERKSLNAANSNDDNDE